MSASLFRASTMSPIIIIGAHRSGTSLVTRLLDDLGLFVGKKLDTNHEAMFFQTLNDAFLHQSGGRWDNPESIDRFLDDQDNLQLTQDYIQLLMRSPQSASFLGVRKYLRYQNLFNLDIPWGWKDPRNTYTLPFWLMMFPQAKVIHVYRHGMDVAKSLNHRCKKSFGLQAARYGKYRWAYAVKPKTGGFKESLLCNSVEGGFDLWERYIKMANHHVEHLGTQAMGVQFEALAHNPLPMLEQLANFAQLTPTAAQFDQAAGKIKSTRCLAYKSDESSNILARAFDARLQRYGYSA
jgi:Sulfotransferase family